MSRNPTESRALLPELEAPQYLRDKYARVLADVPYLGLGYRKSQLPTAVHQRLLEHLRTNLRHFRAEKAIDEMRTAAKAFIPALLLQDLALNAQLGEDLRPLHEEWAGMPLVLSHCCGIRCYQRGTFLYRHLDQETHVIGSTICVDHALSSPWPFSIQDIAGEVSQISVDPVSSCFTKAAVFRMDAHTLSTETSMRRSSSTIAQRPLVPAATPHTTIEPTASRGPLE